MSKPRQIMMLTIVLVISFGIALTAKGQTPTSAEIARTATSIKLDPQNSTTAERDGMKVTVMPADLTNIRTAQLEKGYVIALIDVTGGPDGCNGRHNLFVSKYRDGWRVFLESNGKVKELENAQIVGMKDDERKPRPRVAMPSTELCVIQCWGSGINAYCLVTFFCADPR